MSILGIPSAIVSVAWLAANLNHPNIVLLQATMQPINGTKINFASVPTIPHSRQFDLDTEMSDHTSDLPHTRLNANDFEYRVQKLGINSKSTIVVFDSMGIYSSPRAYWMFRSMGFDRIAVLDGGLPEWIRQGHKTELMQNTTVSMGNFKVSPDRGIFCDAALVVDSIQTRSHQVIDARSRDRFLGNVSEPRPGLVRGHIPLSLNLPFTEVLRDGKFKPKEELQFIFRSLVDIKTPIIISCGSGVTACVVAMAAELSGHESIVVYDGSWSEWGREPHFPIEK